jgi:hypothetical protein
MGQKLSKKVQRLDSSQEKISKISSDTAVSSTRSSSSSLSSSCCICLEVCQANQLICGSSCEHSFCSDCGKNWIQSEIASWSTGEIRCPNHTECGTKVDLFLLRGILSSEEFETLSQRQFEFLLSSDPSFHRCCGGEDSGFGLVPCSYSYQYDEDPSYCSNNSSSSSSYKIGEEVFFTPPSSRYLISGLVVEKMSDDQYKVKSCRPCDHDLASFAVNGKSIFPVNQILQYGTEVDYLNGERTFFNRPRSYLITGVKRVKDQSQSLSDSAPMPLSPMPLSSSSPQYVYELTPKGNGALFGNISPHDLTLTQMQYLRGQKTSQCPLCRVISCRCCGVIHPLNVTCEAHQLRQQQDQENILQMNLFRQKTLLALSPQGGGGGGGEGQSSHDDTESSLSATLTLLNQLEIRICRRCNNGVSKASGCDKMMCRCGYKFCYHCGVENANCQCTPSSHVYIDNVNGGHSS